MIYMEGTHDNDDEEFSFIHIAAATANVTRYLKIDQQKEEPSSQREGGSSDEREHTEKLEYIKRRLADLRAFERVAMYGPGRKWK